MKLKNFGELLKDFRIKRGLSLGELEDKIGMNLARLWDLENGNYEPTFAEWMLIKEQLQLTEEEENQVIMALNQDAMFGAKEALESLNEEIKKVSEILEVFFSHYRVWKRMVKPYMQKEEIKNE